MAPPRKNPAATCSVDGCEAEVYGASLCREHDNAARRAKRAAKPKPLHPIGAASLTNRRR